MIRIVLISGFLGAGKTTLMKKLLDIYCDCKIGVIINEFGKVNIDSKLIERDGIQMAELSNGSIFCACIKDKFVDAFIAMSKEDIDLLFIEASGLADPSNMLDIVNAVRIETNDNYIYQGNICVVDGENFSNLVDVLPALSRQVRHANGVILNKMDLISEYIFSQVCEKITSINQSVKIYPASFCDLDIKKIIDEFAPTVIGSEKTTNTYESRPAVFIIHGDETIELDKLKSFIDVISKDSFRIKGFAKTKEGIYEVSGVSNHIIYSLWNNVEETEIVVISAVGIKMMSLITKYSREILDGRLYV